MPLQTIEFKQHPLLEQLALPQMAVSLVGEEELRNIFITSCNEQDLKNLTILLNFDYQILSQLSPEHPFYLASNPFANIAFITDCIAEANRLGLQNTSLYLQKHISPYLDEQLSSETELYSKISAISLVALYQPNLAFKHLSTILSTNTEHGFYNKKYSRSILKALEYLAATKEYFQFSADALLTFSSKEKELKDIPEYYKALHFFIGLFHNAGAKTNASLQERYQYLLHTIEIAEKNNDENCLAVLIKALGVAADVFNLGEHLFTQDSYYDKYISNAVTLLMRYAGRQNSLSVIAEGELHELLQSTITEPNIRGASDIPYTIYRLFLHYNRQWSIDPFLHLKSIEKDLQDPDSSEKTIKMLTRHLECLKSLTGDRSFITADFKLYRSSKNDNKFCKIDSMLPPETAIELHEQQSLTERLISAQTSKLSKIESSYFRATYLVGNFGLVISDIPHQQGGEHRRVFRSIPIKLPRQVITGGHTQGHAEEELYAYLLQEEHIHYLLNEFRKEHHLDALNHKVYAVIFDLHGTYDMCVSCSKRGGFFQNQFREKLLTVLPNEQMITLRKYPSQLPVIIRYSSNTNYHYPANPNLNKQGILYLMKQKGEKRNLGYTKKESFDPKRDIKRFSANLLLHGNTEWHDRWLKKRDDFYGKALHLPSWTAFVSAGKYNQLSDEMKAINYTRAGEVDTATPIKSLSKLSKLDLN